jgi:hypothetical protein
MPVRRRLKGRYGFKFVSADAIEGTLHIEIDKQKKRLSMHGSTTKGDALVVSGRIVLRDNYLAFVMETVPGVGGTEARYFIECDLTVNAKVPFAPDNKWSRIDGDGYGSLQIRRA